MKEKIYYLIMVQIINQKLIFIGFVAFNLRIDIFPDNIIIVTDFRAIGSTITSEDSNIFSQYFLETNVSLKVANVTAISHLGKLPWDAIALFVSLLKHTFEYAAAVTVD
jgi:hypothetical protein